MFLIVAGAAGFILLAAMWFLGDLEYRTKATFTVLYAVSWGLLLIDGWLTAIALLILDGLIWFVTFGSPSR